MDEFGFACRHTGQFNIDSRRLIQAYWKVLYVSQIAHSAQINCAIICLTKTSVFLFSSVRHALVPERHKVTSWRPIDMGNRTFDLTTFDLLF